MRRRLEDAVCILEDVLHGGTGDGDPVQSAAVAKAREALPAVEARIAVLEQADLVAIPFVDIRAEAPVKTWASGRRTKRAQSRGHGVLRVHRSERLRLPSRLRAGVQRLAGDHHLRGRLRVRGSPVHRLLPQCEQRRVHRVDAQLHDSVAPAGESRHGWAKEEGDSAVRGSPSSFTEPHRLFLLGDIHSVQDGNWNSVRRMAILPFRIVNLCNGSGAVASTLMEYDSPSSTARANRGRQERPPSVPIRRLMGGASGSPLPPVFCPP